MPVNSTVSSYDGAGFYDDSYDPDIFSIPRGQRRMPMHSDRYIEYSNGGYVDVLDGEGEVVEEKNEVDEAIEAKTTDELIDQILEDE